MRASEQNKQEAIRCQVDLMEKEIVYLVGRRRIRAKKAYLRLLRSCGSTCGWDEPVYLDRC
jgi:hypothetical protein